MIPQHGSFVAKATTTATPAMATPPRTPGPMGRKTPRPLSLHRRTTLTPSPFRKPVLLGMTPRSLRTGLGSRANPAPFTPPFKKEAPPPSSQLALTQPPATPKPPPCVYDMSARDTSRLTYQQAGLCPRRQTVSTAQQSGVPAEVRILLCEPTKASQYVFAGVAPGTTCGPAEALSALHEAGGVRANLPWVTNHWSLLLWKLAAYVAANPASVSTYWTFDTVVEQLRYRYEREYHQKQYSAVKQLQEQLTPPTRPMVLCVHQILRYDDADDESASVVLQLTDGWYKIRAEVDAPMRRALERGRLRVGQKLGIMYAKVRGRRMTYLTSFARLRKAHLYWRPCIRLTWFSLRMLRRWCGGIPS